MRIGSMATDRYCCLVGSPSPDRIIIVGGVGADYRPLESVEECAVV